MARSSVRKAKLDGMRRKTNDETADWIAPQKNGARSKSQLKKAKTARSSQSYKKRV